MDPILEEMRRARDVDQRSLRRWTEYLCALVVTKDDRIAALEAQIALIASRRGPGRPTNEDIKAREAAING